MSDCAAHRLSATEAGWFVPAMVIGSLLHRVVASA